MSSWGGVSWQVPDLPGAVAGVCHSPGPGASVISLLALSSYKEVALLTSRFEPPTGGLGPHLGSSDSSQVHKALRLDSKKDVLEGAVV